MSTSNELTVLVAALELYAGSAHDDIFLRIVLKVQTDALLASLHKQIPTSTVSELGAMHALAAELHHIHDANFTQAACSAHLDSIKDAALTYLTAFTAKYN